MKTPARSVRTMVVTMLLGLSAVDPGPLAAEAPRRLTVSEGFSNPIGFYDATPAFSWQLPVHPNIKAQGAYQVVVATSPKRLTSNPDLWDSGKVASDQSTGVAYEGAPLHARQTAYWRIRYWDQKEEASDWSPAATFELGLLENTDWNARWMHLPPEPAFTERPDAEIVIEVARYGVLDEEAQQIDVTGIVRDRVAERAYRIEASNGMAGADPADGTVKSLSVVYRVGGEQRERIVREGETLDLISGAVAGSEKRFIPELFRRRFSPSASVERARLYVTARGLYEVWINGRKVGDDFMTPGWTPYTKRIETLTYDVTGFLTKEENAIGAVLGEGWYAGRLGWGSGRTDDRQPALLLQLEMTLADGTIETILSDENWKGSREGPLRYSGIYDGEVYDARRDMSGWTEVGFDDSGWQTVTTEPIDPRVRLVPKRHHPVRATEDLVPIAITEPSPGKHVFDLGQNIVGWPRLALPVDEDTTITVRVAEMLQQDGTLYTDNYRGARSTDTYTAGWSGPITWSPKFTFHGFRYVELSGLPEGAQPEASWVTGVVLHSDFGTSGTFDSSHEKLNQLQRNITWGLRGNFLDIPTDCPQRDERLGWTGDAQVFASTSLFNRDVHSFWASWLESMRDDQWPDGGIPNVVPNILDSKSGGPGWADAATVIPWTLYVVTSDRNVLVENYDMMKRWVGWYEARARDGIVDVTSYGDWLQPYSIAEGNKGDTPKDLIGTAYFAHSADLTARAARVLGRDADAGRYSVLFDRIRHAFTEAYFDETATLTTPQETQTGYLLALGFDLLPDELRARAAANLARQVRQAEGHLRTGFLGTPLLAPVLSRYGYDELAYGALFKESYPSWFFSIDQGATTMWERWNSYSHADGFGDAGMNSFNHYAYGAIGRWMYEHIAGLAPDPKQPGYKHFFIRPMPGGPLTSASATVETPYGLAASGWERSGDGLRVTATIPPNTTATTSIPLSTEEDLVTCESGEGVDIRVVDGHAIAELSAGTYAFRVTPP